MSLEVSILCKICTKCKVEKSIDDYHKNKNKTHSQCKECKNQDRLKYSGTWRDKDIEKRKYLWEYKSQHPCVKCGESDPIVLVFDHLEDFIKEFDIANSNGNLELLKKEISKCQMLCSNCHAKKTAKDFGWYKEFLTEEV